MQYHSFFHFHIKAARGISLALELFTKAALVKTIKNYSKHVLHSLGYLILIKAFAYFFHFGHTVVRHANCAEYADLSLLIYHDRFYIPSF